MRRRGWPRRRARRRRWIGGLRQKRQCGGEGPCLSGLFRPLPGRQGDAAGDGHGRADRRRAKAKHEAPLHQQQGREEGRQGGALAHARRLTSALLRREAMTDRPANMWGRARASGQLVPHPREVMRRSLPETGHVLDRDRPRAERAVALLASTLPVPARVYCGSIRASRTTRVHFARSDAISRPNASGASGG